jgi:hypothetical protein
MDAKILIDSIVQQTTVLIAQLSTAAGVRAPLSHVADQVFVQLAKEIEAQGVSRKVVADMFGLALRTYQRKVQRLTESATVRDKTLWEAVMEFLAAGAQNRQRIRERFHYDGEEHVGAVLSDLVSSGLVYCTGRGESALFGVTSQEQQALVAAGDNADALTYMVWLRVFNAKELTRAELGAQLNTDGPALAEALAALVADGRLTEVRPDTFHSSNLVLPVGSERGWEAAVFNQFSVVAQTIAAKLALGPRSSHSDTIGGATYMFTVSEGHPHHQQVLSLLGRLRGELDALWREVSEYNKLNPVPQDATQVCFYFGQNVKPNTEERENGSRVADGELE